MHKEIMKRLRLSNKYLKSKQTDRQAEKTKIYNTTIVRNFQEPPRKDI